MSDAHGDKRVSARKKAALTPDLLLEDGDDDRVSLTTVQDVAQIVGRAIEYEGEWPTMGGINGCELSVGDVTAIGEESPTFVKVDIELENIEMFG